MIFVEKSQYVATTVTTVRQGSCVTVNVQGRPITIGEVIAAQAPTPDGWVCPTCRHHGGGINCAKGFFIAVAGGNTSGCCGWEEERRKAGRQ